MRATVHLRLLPAILLLLPAAARAQESSPASLFERTFDQAWRLIRDRHYDPTLGGLDWDAVGRELRLRAAAAADADALTEVLTDLVARIPQSHFAVFLPGGRSAARAPAESSGPGGDPADEDPDDVPSGGDLGLDLRLVEGRALIVRVDSGGPAAAAGLRPGFAILRIGDRDLGRLIARRSAAAADARHARFEVAAALQACTVGSAGSEARIVVLDDRDQEREVRIRRRPMKGELTRLGFLPPHAAFCEVERLPGGVGRIGFNIFFMNLLQSLEEAVASLADSRGIILDLRGNVGGIGGMAMSVARLICREDGLLGRMRSRTQNIRFPVLGNEDAYAGPVVLLVDELSASTTEILAGGLQEMGRVRVVGTTTAGAALPSVVERLETGHRLQYVVADFTTPSGAAIEGRGVTPDVDVPLTRAELLRSGDIRLARALEVLAAPPAGR